MSRIRSIHQGFFTDENIVTCSAFARLLLIGIWTEADDQGLFEWKPVTIKIKLFPVDSIDIPSLLSELMAANAISKFSHDGREYGAIRNFRKFQRPKTPNAVFPMTPEWGNYVGLTKPNGEKETSDDPPKEEPEPVKRSKIPRKGEIHPQMEGRGEDSSDTDVSGAELAPIDLDEDPKAILFTSGLKWLVKTTGNSEKTVRSSLGEMLKLAGGDQHAGLVLGIIRDTKRERKAEPVAWIMQCLRDKSKSKRFQSFSGMGAI